MRRLQNGVLAATALLALTALPVVAQVDPAVLDQRVVDAVNRADVTTVLTLLTDDVVLQVGPSCGQTPCVGKDAARRELESEMARHVQIRLLDVRVLGSRVMDREEVREDDIRVPGPVPVERIIETGVIEMRGDKVAAIRTTPDLTDSQTAAFLAAVRAPQGRDGQSFFTQSAFTRASFVSVWGDRAAQQWTIEHDDALTRLGR